MYPVLTLARIVNLCLKRTIHTLYVLFVPQLRRHLGSVRLGGFITRIVSVLVSVLVLLLQCHCLSIIHSDSEFSSSSSVPVVLLHILSSCVLLLVGNVGVCYAGHPQQQFLLVLVAGEPPGSRAIHGANERGGRNASFLHERERDKLGACDV